MKEKKRKPLAKRLMALLLIGAMLAPAATPAHAASEDTTADAPKIRVVATLVDGGQYLEVGLNIESKGDGAEGKENGFQSAGVLLKYTPNVLTPVSWGETASVVAVPGLEGGEAALVPSKGADELSGKLAEAIQAEGQGYLFLSAETARTSVLHQKLPEDTAKEEPAPTADEQTPGGYPILRIKQAESGAEQAVVVRFRVNEKTPASESAEAEKYTLSELAAALDLVGTTETDTKALAVFPLAGAGGVTYLADNRTVTASGTGTDANLSFVWIENGVTANAGTGGGSTEGIISVTAFDWDGTMLGSFIFASDSNPAKQEANAQEALDAFMAQEEIAAVLNSHAGYDFLTWVKNEDDIPTSYGMRVSSSTNTKLEELDVVEADKADFSTMTQSTTVKAAYTTNGDCQLGEGLDTAEAMNARRYTTSLDSYGRFGTSQSFSIKIKVERGNVPRATDGALRVKMTINGVNVYSQYALTGADTEVVEIAPYAQSNPSGVFTGVSVVEWTVIDEYGTSDWVGAAPRTTLTDCQSNASFAVRDVGTAKNVAVWDEGTYPFYGVIAGINDAMESYHQLKLEDPTVMPNNSNMGGITLPILRSVGIPPLALAAMRAALYDKYVENGASPLDYSAIYEAASGTPLL